MRYKSIIKGALSKFIKRFRHSDNGTNGTFNAEGSYAIFMRYVIALARAGESFDMAAVVEFGPGASFGVGIAALLVGARKYYPIDLVDHTDVERNLAVFDRISDLLLQRTQIPTTGWCSRIFPIVDDPTFPHDLLPESLLARTLAPERVDEIRRDLQTKSGHYITPRSSVDVRNLNLDEPIDVIISESVLEHVDDLEGTYDAFARWLAPHGVMAHLIDYGSHNLADTWNGHWACPSALWSIVRGKRAFLINRIPHHGHLDLLNSRGMQVVHSELLRRVDGVIQDQFAPEFRLMHPSDATTALASIVCRKEIGKGANHCANIHEPRAKAF